jgi:hypothetical protein
MAKFTITSIADEISAREGAELIKEMRSRGSRSAANAAVWGWKLFGWRLALPHWPVRAPNLTVAHRNV